MAANGKHKRYDIVSQASAEPEVPSGPVFLRRPQVEQLTGLSRGTLYWLLQEGRFPKPIPLGKHTVAWLLAEVRTWQNQRIADRNQPRRARRAQGKERAHA
jgi:prophage regulatory protein